jgi:hypothetical protein
LRQKVIGSKGKGRQEQDGGRYRDLPGEEEGVGMRDDPDEARRWEQEEQQVYLPLGLVSTCTMLTRRCM